MRKRITLGWVVVLTVGVGFLAMGTVEAYKGWSHLGSGYIDGRRADEDAVRRDRFVNAGIGIVLGGIIVCSLIAPGAIQEYQDDQVDRADRAGREGGESCR